MSQEIKSHFTELFLACATRLVSVPAFKDTQRRFSLHLNSSKGQLNFFLPLPQFPEEDINL